MLRKLLLKSALSRTLRGRDNGAADSNPHGCLALRAAQPRGSSRHRPSKPSAFPSSRLIRRPLGYFGRTHETQLLLRALEDQAGDFARAGSSRGFLWHVRAMRTARTHESLSWTSSIYGFVVRPVLSDSCVDMAISSAGVLGCLVSYRLGHLYCDSSVITMRFDMNMTCPNHALQRTRRECRGCSRRVPCTGSLSLGH